MANYFQGIDDELILLQNRINRDIDLENDPYGQFKMNVVRNAFMTITCAMQSVNSVMGIEAVAKLGV